MLLSLSYAIRCLKCDMRQVFRNVEQLIVHQAAPEEGIGRASGCKKVDLAVRDLYRRRLLAINATKKRKAESNVLRTAVDNAEAAEKRSKLRQDTLTASFDRNEVGFDLNMYMNLLLHVQHSVNFDFKSTVFSDQY